MNILVFDSYRMSRPEIEQLLSKIDTGTLLDSLDKETQVAVFEQRYIREPIVMPTVNSQLALLRAIFSRMVYDTYTGAWLNTRQVRLHPPGSKAGYIQEPKGHRLIHVLGDYWKASHLVTLLVLGHVPKDNMLVDHLNGIADDDKMENLRYTTPGINSKNCKRRCDNTTGYAGVWYDPATDKYRSCLNVNHKRINIGRFSTIIEAHEAREAYIAAHPELGFTSRHGKV